MPAFALDVRTLLIIFTMVRIVQASSIFYVWKIHRQFKPAKDRAAGSFIAAAVIILVGLSDLIPMWISVVVGNTLTLYGWMVFNSGIIRATKYRMP